jgi:hypothetical protein
MRQRIRYLPIEDVTEGMTLAEPVADSYQLSLLPSGATLTQENMQQLLAHHVEFVCVALPDERSAESMEVDRASAARQVLEIFDGADLTEPNIAALFNCVLMYRSA